MSELKEGLSIPQLIKPIDYKLSTPESFIEATKLDMLDIYTTFSEVIADIKYDSFYYFLKILTSEKNLTEIDFRDENPQSENDSHGSCVDLAIELKTRLQKLGYYPNLTSMTETCKTGTTNKHLAVSVPLIREGLKGYLLLDERTGIFWIPNGYNIQTEPETEYQFFRDLQTTFVSKNKEEENSYFITTQKIDKTEKKEVKTLQFFPNQDYLYPHNFLMKKILPNIQYLVYRTRDTEGRNKAYCMLDLRNKPYNFRFCTSKTDGTEIALFTEGEKIENILFPEEINNLSAELGLASDRFAANINIILQNISKLEELGYLKKA